MARIKKYADTLNQTLTSFQTLVNDTNPNSDYFRVTEFKEAFTGGKNGFLIEGSEYLKETTEIKIQILDVNGDPIYYEPGNGVPEYYEGLSKPIAVYVYEDTPIGEAKITILGELKTFKDTDGVIKDIPDDWKGVYNVKWERTFKVNRLLSNEDKVRFYRRPEVSIIEVVKPIFSNVVAPKIQKGYLTGTPLLPTAGTSLHNVTSPTTYLLTTTDNTFWTASVVGTTLNFDGGGYYQPFVESIVNSRQLIVGNPYVDDITGVVSNLGPIGYTASFNYTEGVDNLKTALTGSFAKITLADITTFIGDCARVKIFRKSTSDLSDFQFVQEIQLESNELLIDLESTTKNQENYGIFDSTNYLSYWEKSSNSLVTSFDQSFLFNSVKLNSSNVLTSFYTTKSLNITENIEYTLDFNIRKESVGFAYEYIEAYLSGSKQSVVSGSPTTVQVKQSITTLKTQNALLQKQNITENIKAEQIDNAKLYFDVKGTGWHIADVSLKASQETAFSPDEITFIQSVPRSLPVETFIYRFEFYDINNNYIPVLVEETKTFDGGNLQTIRKQLKLVPSLSGFQFDSGSNPVPPTTIFIEEQKTLLTGSVHYTSQSFDFFGNDLSASGAYTSSGAQFPGLLLGIGTNNVRMTVGNFTGSRSDINVQLVRLTGEVEGYTDTINIYKILDGFGGVNHLIRPYRGTQIRNSSTSSLEIQAVRIDGINDINISSTTKPEKGWPDFKLHVISASLNPLTEPEKFITLAVASSSRYIYGLTSGSLGSGEINYNAVFNRDSIEFRRTVYLISSIKAASGYAYNVSSSVVASIQLEDLQDGLGSGIVTYNADSFTINPRTEGVFRPEFAFATASFAKRSVAGESEFLTASFKVWPSMSINKDWIPEYWMYYTTQSCHTASIEITAIDENKNPIYSKDKDGLGLSINQSKNLTLTFTYTEPWTSASVSVDKTFTIVPEGKQGDETIVFEVNPISVTLGANSRGIVNDYKPSITDIRLKQGSKYLAFSSSAHTLNNLNTHGTFYIATASIVDTNITAGNVHFTSSGDGTQYTASLIVSASSNMNELSGSIEYPLIIHPYYTSSIYTASVVVNYTKVLEGAPPIQIVISPQNVTLTADEVGFVTPAGYSAANTTIQVKEGDDFLKLTTTESFANADARKGTYTINSIQPSVSNGIFTILTGSFSQSMSSSKSGLTGRMNYNLFDYPFVSASALYTIQVYPYALGAGHLPTSSIYTRTQTFTKNVDAAKARTVNLSALSQTITYDRDTNAFTPEGDNILTATAFNVTASGTNGSYVYYYWFDTDGNDISTDPLRLNNEFNPNDYTGNPGPGEVYTYIVKITDGNPYVSPTLNPFRAESSVSVSGVKQGADAYKLVASNENTSITADLWTTQFTGSGMKITTFKGTNQLAHVHPFVSATMLQSDYSGIPIGYLGYSSASIFFTSSWITPIARKFPAGSPASIGDIIGWNSPAVNTSGQIVYKVDFEGGAFPVGGPVARQTQFVTQSLSVQFIPPAPYAAQLENESAAAVYKVSGQFTLDATFTKIRAVRGDIKLNCVTSFTGAQLDAYGVNGYKEKALVKISYISGHITLGGGLSLAPGYDVLPVDAEGRAITSGIQTWTSPETNQTAKIVYEIDCEGRQKLYKTQSFSVQFEGNTGPGVVMRGNWLNTLDYIGQVETTNYRRDAVIYPPNGNPTTYYAAKSGSGPATYKAHDNGALSPGNIVGAQTPSNNPNNEHWEYLGTQEFFVAAKIAIFDESYVKNTLNIGTKDGNSAFANIVLSGGRNDPYMAMGQAGTAGKSGDQTSTGVIGYDRAGIFLGIYENGAAGTTGRFSIKSSDGNRALKWDGDTLTIVGSINQVAPGQNAGTLRGAWVSATLYYANDIVTYGGQSWQCTSATSHTSTNNTNASTGYPGAGPWTVAAAAGAPGNNGTSGADGNNGTSGLNGNSGTNGGPGPGVVYRGEYNAATAYFHSADGTRRDVVKYSGAYYLANNVSKTGLTTWGTPGVADWSTFGATFSSVATDILLAQDANIYRGLVIGTDGSTTGYLRSANANSLAGDGTSATKGYYLNNLGQLRLGDSITAANAKYIYWDGTDLNISGIVRLKDSNNVTKVLLDYGVSSTADPLNATSGTIAITGYASGTATFQNGVLSGQGASGYLQYPPGVTAGTIAPGDWPFAPTWNVDNVITAPLTAAYELTVSFPVTALRKTTWVSGTKNNGPLVDMRLYVKNSAGTSMYTGFGGAGYVNTPTFDADFAGNFYAQIDPASPPANVVLYMSGVNLVAGTAYTITLQYIVYNVEYDNYITIDYYLPNINIAYNASVASTVINQVGFNMGQDTDRYMLTRPDFLDSMDLTTFPNDGTHTNVSFQKRRTLGHIGGTFLLLNANHIEWHNTMQRIYINNALYPRSNRSAGGNFMTSHFFGGYNRAFQILRAYAMFEPDATTNCTSVYTDIWNIGYSFNIEQVTYVTTNTFQVFFVEPLQDVSTYLNATVDRGYYGVVVAANGTATGPVPQIVRVFDTYPTSFKIELTGEDNTGTRINVLVYK